ncbi:galactose-3-O-sulfotransferase 2-like [Branchiostoma floridae x Branchiostoma japonicum]
MRVFRLYDVPPYLRVSSSIKSKSSVCQPNTNIAFIKTHKTGSSTVMQIFQRFGFLRNLSFLLPKGSINQLYPFGIRDRMYLPAPIEGRPFDILTHHTVYDRAGITQLLSANVTFVTIVREPMERLKSAFNFYKLAWRYKIPGPDPLLRFLENPGKFEHHITRNRDYETKNNIALELGFPLKSLSSVKEKDIREFVEKISREFDLVMVLEYFDESLVLLRRLLCWDMRDILNFKYNSFQYGKLGNTSFSEKLIQNYRQHSAIDYALYEHFNRTLWSKINKAGSDFREELAHFRWLQTTMKTECSRKFDNFSAVYIGKTAWNAEFYIDSTFCTWMKIFHVCYLTLLQDRNLRHRDKSLRIQQYRQPSGSCGLYSKPYCILCTQIRKLCTHHEYVTHLYQEGLLVPDQSSSAKLTNPVPHHGGKPEPIS